MSSEKVIPYTRRVPSHITKGKATVTLAAVRFTEASVEEKDKPELPPRPHRGRNKSKTVENLIRPIDPTLRREMRVSITETVLERARAVAHAQGLSMAEFVELAMVDRIGQWRE